MLSVRSLYFVGFILIACGLGTYAILFRGEDTPISSPRSPSALALFRDHLSPGRSQHVAEVTNRYRPCAALDSGTFLHSIRAFGDLSAGLDRWGGVMNGIRTYFDPYQGHDGLAFVRASDSEEGRGEPHRDQVLSILGEQGVPLDTRLSFRAGEFKVHEFLEESMSAYTHAGEVEWTVVAFASYLPPKTEWTNRFGDTYSFDDAVKLLIARPLEFSSCNGTHGLYALAYVRDMNERFGGKLLSKDTGQLVTDYLRRIAETLAELQDADGSIPPDWYQSVVAAEWYDRAVLLAGTAVAEDADVEYTRWLFSRTNKLPSVSGRLSRVVAAGHHLEWLMLNEDLITDESFLRRSLQYCEQEVAAQSENWEGADAPNLDPDMRCPIHHMVRVLRLAYGLDSGD